MKSKEEIEQLANEYGYACAYSKDEHRSFIQGYTQCQEDMAAEIKEAYEQGLKDGYTSIPESYVPSFNSLNKQD